MSALASAWDAIVAVVSRGKIAAVHAGRRTLVQVRLLEGELKERVELIMPYGMSAMPAGGDVILLTVGASRDHVVAIGVDDSSLRIRDLAPGEFGFRRGAQQIAFRQARLDIVGNVLNVVFDGDVNIRSGGTVTVKAALTVFDGDVLVTGDISDQDGTHGTVGAFRAAYDAHRHGGIDPGGGTTDVTDTPI